jgi:lysophospholipase L1-like esterase
MPISSALAFMLSAAPLAAPPPSLPTTFTLAKDDRQASPPVVSRAHLYESGRYGFEPGGTEESFLFSIAVPEGNYRVTLRLGDRRSAGLTSVKAEARRLMLRDVATRKGAFREVSFLVNVRTPQLAPPPETAPGGIAVQTKPREQASYAWDEKLTLEFLDQPKVASITVAPVEAPTLYLAGDSTVTDQRYEPAASWGQMLPAMLDDKIAVANNAESGETLKSFITELRLAKILSRIKRGDWLFIQFGHNDQKANWPQTYADPVFTYPAYLRTYIAEARARGAHPVLVTSPERRNFDAQGKIIDTLGDYPKTVRAVAQSEGVPLIDLNSASRAIYEALGPDVTPLAFNDEGKDKTHHDNYGAWLLASAVAEQIRAQITELAPHVTMPYFDPTHPPMPNAVKIAPSLAHSSQRPAGN